MFRGSVLATESGPVFGSALWRGAQRVLHPHYSSSIHCGFGFLGILAPFYDRFISSPVRSIKIGVGPLCLRTFASLAVLRSPRAMSYTRQSLHAATKELAFQKVSVHSSGDVMNVDASWGTHKPASVKGKVLQLDSVLDCICDELVYIQALRPVCRDCRTAATDEILCHLAFHEKDDIMLDPYSDPHEPIWKRCCASY